MSHERFALYFKITNVRHVTRNDSLSQIIFHGIVIGRFGFTERENDIDWEMEKVVEPAMQCGYRSEPKRLILGAASGLQGWVTWLCSRGSKVEPTT